MSRIMLVEELRERERLTLHILRNVLERRGHEVRISRLDRFVGESLAFEPDLVMINTVNSLEEYLNNFWWIGRRCRIIALHWEQILNPHSYRRFVLDAAVQNGFVDGRIAWGPAFRRVLLHLNPAMDGRRVRITGSMKHSEGSFYADVARGDVGQLVGIDATGYEAVVLFTTSFSLAALPLSAIRQNMPFNPFVAEARLQHVRRQTAAIEAVTRAARANPDHLFIVRAHPSKHREYSELYEQALAGSNVVVNSTGPVSALLHMSDLLVTSTSTTLWDAHVQGVPSVNLRLEDDPIQEYGLLPDSSDRFGWQVPFAEFGCTPLSAYSTRRDEPGLAEVIREWLGDLGPAAFDRAADFAEESLERPMASRQLQMAQFGRPIVARRALGGIAERFLNQRSRKRVVSAIESGFDYDALAGLLLRGRVVTPANMDVRER